MNGDEMIGQWTNHRWQSTLLQKRRTPGFAGVAVTV